MGLLVLLYYDYTPKLNDSKIQQPCWMKSKGRPGESDQGQEIVLCYRCLITNPNLEWNLSICKSLILLAITQHAPVRSWPFNTGFSLNPRIAYFDLPVLCFDPQICQADIICIKKGSIDTHSETPWGRRWFSLPFFYPDMWQWKLRKTGQVHYTNADKKWLMVSDL